MQRKVKNVGPHIAIIKFNVFVHRLLPDGSIDPEVIDCSDLGEKYQIGQLGEFTITGYDKWNCVSKLKTVLEGLRYNDK